MERVCFRQKYDKSLIVEEFSKLPATIRVGDRVAHVEKTTGAHRATVRRILAEQGLIGNLESPKGVRVHKEHTAQVRKQGAATARLVLAAAQSVTTGKSELGRAIAGGLVIGEVIAGQRVGVAKLRAEIDRLSGIVAELTRPPIDGEPIRGDEVHKAVASQVKLVEATLKLHEAERSQWGIRHDQSGGSYGSVLDQLAASASDVVHATDAPPPVETPPIDLEGT